MLIGILEASAKWLLSLSVALLNAKVITVLTHTHIQRQYPVCEWSSGLFNVQKDSYAFMKEPFSVSFSFSVSTLSSLQ